MAEVTALEIIRQLAAMSTPADEFKELGETEPESTLEDFEGELSSDRMEDDARALWRMVDAARECLRDAASAEAKLMRTLEAFQEEQR